VGAVGAAAAAASGSSGGVPILVPGGQPGSLIHSSNGFGSSSNVPGLDAPPDAGLGAVQGNAGSAPLLAIVLSIIVLAIGAFAGVRAWHTPSRDQPAEPSSSA
jgi:hypothetical protein